MLVYTNPDYPELPATNLSANSDPDLYELIATYTGSTAKNDAIQRCNGNGRCNYIIEEPVISRYRVVTILRNSDIGLYSRITGGKTNIYKKVSPIISGFTLVYRNDATTFITPPTTAVLRNDDSASTSLGTTYTYYMSYDAISNYGITTATCKYILISKQDQQVMFFTNLKPDEVGTALTQYMKMVYIYKKN
jgi:hypothetical protein